jgi:hypothetical protein
MLCTVNYVPFLLVNYILIKLEPKKRKWVERNAHVIPASGVFIFGINISLEPMHIDLIYYQGISPLLGTCYS